MEETSDQELVLGMEVRSLDEAYDLYNSYALRKGFSVRKGGIRYDKNGKARQRVFLCSKEGCNDEKRFSSERKCEKFNTRTGCKAEIRFNLTEEGKWKISFFNAVHNHELATSFTRKFLRSGRKIIDAHASVITSMVEAGIRPSNSYSFLVNEVSGTTNVGFSLKKSNNFVQRWDAETISAQDGQSLLNYFRQKQAEEPMFFYSIQVDHENRMTNFFWRDGRSRLDYDCFNDVVIFDSTFRANKYEMICAPFLGVNHHRKNILLGCALLVDESTKSFIWLFETFLESMSNQKPKTIFTGRDQAMTSAVEKVFPSTQHQFCLWHIERHATQGVGKLFDDKRFQSLFYKCLYDCNNEAGFESLWKEMLEENQCAENKWLNELYESRRKWSPAFSLDIFSAGIRYNHRTESISNVFNQISCETLPLTHYVEQYDNKAKQWRDMELQDDIHSKSGPVVVRGGGLVAHAARVYTGCLFRLFEEEFYKFGGLRVNEVGDGTFHVLESDSQIMHVVTSNMQSPMIACSCKLFESLGVLCCHAVKILDRMNCDRIPKQYILKRWTNDAKKGVSMDAASCDESGSSSTSRFRDLMHLGQHVFLLGSESESKTKMIKRKLLELLGELETDIDSLELRGIGNVAENESVNCEPTDNPTKGKTKGESGKRIKNSIEKQSKKVAKVNSSSQQEVACSVPPPHMYFSHYQMSQHVGMQPLNPCIFGHPSQSFTVSPTKDSTFTGSGGDPSAWCSLPSTSTNLSETE